ncbi:FAD-binding protein, partial [Staphylococcus aureus]|nr:FAD-binding protein [Staphylococcus aureus]
WSGEIRTTIYQTSPTSIDDLVAAVNWAAARGWRVRPRGFTHGWAPTALDNSVNSLSRVLVVDMKGLNGITTNATDRS